MKWLQKTKFLFHGEWFLKLFNGKKFDVYDGLIGHVHYKFMSFFKMSYFQLRIAYPSIDVSNYKFENMFVFIIIKKVIAFKAKTQTT